MKRRKTILWLVVVLLYGITWIGGCVTHARDLQASTWAKYRAAQEINAEWRALDPAGSNDASYLKLREDGPITGVNWCVPLLPGILLADSYYVVGPLYGRGMAKVVFYYGVGSMVICDLWGWIA
jgi:hypothetical protein